MKVKAVFPGTFDPFTIGHASLVERSLKVVDEVIIAIGRNEAKNTYFPLEKRKQMIEDLYQNNPKVKVETYDGLTIDFAKKMKASIIIRGIRTVNDFEYEKTIADTNRKIAGVETIILFTEPEYTHISSSIVRELLRFGHDVSGFVPDEMKTNLQQNNK